MTYDQQLETLPTPRGVLDKYQVKQKSANNIRINRIIKQPLSGQLLRMENNDTLLIPVGPSPSTT